MHIPVLNYSVYNSGCLSLYIVEENEKLPSTRELSKDMGVSRNVVIEAYEQLIAEGYLYSKNGCGTYVSEGTTLKIRPMENYIEKKILKKLLNLMIL